MKKTTNEYMQQVQQQAVDVENQLRARGPMAMPNVEFDLEDLPSSESEPVIASAKRTMPSSPGKPARRTPSQGVRITGIWPFKRVVVPPNMYVVHTREGQEKPLHVGLGLSFSYNPWRDSFLVVPSAMQTILINANSICQELQGILIQAYVQWIIDDIEVAYKRLDFSDVEDPLRIVELQLGEQAQAAIKDKVATMSIREVLSDKQPIIEELTRRLKEVAEGTGDGQGLGIRIVTVQIKEAVVSSTTVWENLQKPFRAEQATKARLAEIDSQAHVNEAELADHKARETRRLESESELHERRTSTEAERFNREEAERIRRHRLEQESAQRRIESDASTARVRQESEQVSREREIDLAHKTARKQHDLALETIELEKSDLEARAVFRLAEKEADWALMFKDLAERARFEGEELAAALERQQKQLAVDNAQTEREIAFERLRREIANNLSAEHVRLRAVEMLPEVAHALPKPDRLESIAIGAQGTHTLEGVVASIATVLRRFGLDKEQSGGSGVEPEPTDGEAARTSD